MIEKGIPLPPSQGGGAGKMGITHSLRELAAADIGDSFWVSGDRQKNLWTLAKQATGQGGWYAARNEVKDGQAGVRIWKVKDLD